MNLLERLFRKWNAVKYDPISNEEEIQMKLYILHDHTKREDEKHLAEIRADIHVKWKSTLAEIDRMMAAHGKPVVTELSKKEFDALYPKKKKKSPKLMTA